jgi:hypothetical protein
MNTIPQYKFDALVRHRKAWPFGCPFRAISPWDTRAFWVLFKETPQ